MASVLWSLAVMAGFIAGIVMVGVTAYGLGRHRGLLRARAIVQATAMLPKKGQGLGPMPPERVWALCCDRIARQLEEA